MQNDQRTTPLVTESEPQSRVTWRYVSAFLGATLGALTFINGLASWGEFSIGAFGLASGPLVIALAYAYGSGARGTPRASALKRVYGFVCLPLVIATLAVLWFDDTVPETVLWSVLVIALVIATVMTVVDLFGRYRRPASAEEAQENPGD